MSRRDPDYRGDDGELPFRFEVVRDARQEIFALSLYAGMIAHRISFAIDQWSRSNVEGRACLFMGFRLCDSPETCRFADVSFVSEKRWPADQSMSRTDDYWSVVPELAAYVIRPTDYFTDVIARVDDFLSAGTKSVWLIELDRYLV